MIQKTLSEKILQSLLGRNYMSEMDLVTKTGGDISEIIYECSTLINSGKLIEVGKKYNAKYNKLFRLLTNKIDRQAELTTKATNTQHKQQKDALVKQLVDELREHKNLAVIKEGLNLIQTSDTKFHLKYHQLHKDDFIWAYALVAEHGIRSLIEAGITEEHNIPEFNLV